MWQAEFSEHLLITFGSVFFLSVVLCTLILAFRKNVLRITSRKDLNSVQSTHTAPTPRIGGVAVVLAIVSTLFITAWTPQERFGTIVYLVTLSPILIAGLFEDFGMRISPRSRLIAAILASLMTSLAWGIWVKSINIPVVDVALTFAPLAIALTVFGAAGVTNAFNLMDGLNGLTGFYALSTVIALAAIANQFEVYNLEAALMVLFCAVAGFLFFNFPFGKIFLGDGGAYTLGHTLVWIAIAILNRAPDISAYAILLVFFWPVADTMLSIWRRRVSGKRTDQPDRLHFHQLVLRFLEIRFFGRKHRRIVNPIATLVVVPCAIAPQIFGVMFITNDTAAKASVLVFGLLFVGAYVFGVRCAGKISARKTSGHALNL